MKQTDDLISRREVARLTKQFEDNLIHGVDDADLDTYKKQVSRYYNAYKKGLKGLKIVEQSSNQNTKNPCDLCIYNPPSSNDGKPCTMCPATSVG